MLVVIGRIAGPKVTGDGVKRLPRCRPLEVVAGLYHIWQVAPSVGSRVPGDHAVAGGEVDIASCKYPPAVISSGGGRRAARRQIGDCSIIPGVGARIVAIGFVRRSVPTASINIVAQSNRHQVMVGKWVVCGHRPAICGNIVNLNVKIGADSCTCNAIDFAVEVRRGVEVGGDGVRGQAGIIRIADGIVAPKRSRCIEVLVYAAK